MRREAAAPAGDELPPATERAVAYIRAHPDLPREVVDAELAQNGYLQATRAQAWAAVDRRPARGVRVPRRFGGPARGVRVPRGLGGPGRSVVAIAVIFPVAWILSFVALSLVWGVIRDVMRGIGVPDDTTRLVTRLLAVAVFVIATVVAYQVTRRRLRARR